MKRNFIKTALRNLWRNRGYSLLNIAGLAVGIACASLIFLWAEDEITFDHTVQNYDHIYRVYENQMHDGAIATVSVTPGPMAKVLASEITGIKRAARMTNGLTSALFSSEEKSFYEKGSYTDSAFFSIVKPVFVHGNQKKSFADLHSLIITERMAEKFFSEEDPTGKTLKLDNDALFTITGVIQNPTENSSFQADWYAQFDLLMDKFPWLNRWDANGVATLVELQANTNVAQVNKQLTDFLKTKSSSLDIPCFLFPMRDWHLRDHFTNGIQDGEGQIKYVKLFTAIAWIILILACINFMNLATARSDQRAKEVGVRKTLGAKKESLVLQFISESIVLAFASMLLSIAILYLALPAFNSLAGKTLSLHLSNPLQIFSLLVITMACGLLAGSYPSFYLSSFNPIQVLKNMKMKSSAASGFIRKGLVITQFAVSAAFILATIIIYQQIQYTKNRSLGYRTEQLVYMDVRGRMDKNFNAIKTELINTGAVENATLSMNPVIQLGWYSSDNFKWAGKDPNSDPLITTEAVTAEFISTVGMTLTEGRDFYADAEHDADNIIINETLAKLLGDKSAVGNVITAGDRPLKVVGVVKNFVTGNVFSKSAAPMILTCSAASHNYLTLRLRTTGDIQASLAKVEKVFKTYDTVYPFDYTFMDEEFDALFKTEALIGKLAAVFGVLAIFISCLGLFGLTSYTAQRRSKEIGIRKILGASAEGITSMLSLDFMKLVCIAFTVAFPAAWWLMNRWLESYEYRTVVHWWVFVLVGVVILFITVITVGFQTIRAATVNPARVLRSE